MGSLSYDEIVDKLKSGVYKITHLDRNNREITTYATMNEALAIQNGFVGFRLTEKRQEEDKELGLATVGSLQDKKYIRIDLNGGKIRSISKVRNNKVSNGYDIKVSYEELLSMLIRGKLTVKFIQGNNEKIITATRNPQIVRAMTSKEIVFGSLVDDKRRGVVSVFDCDKKDKRVINYKTLVELVGYEGPEDSQVRVLKVIYYDNKVQGVVFNIMGTEVSLTLENSFLLIGSGICINARTDKTKIHYSNHVPKTDTPTGQYISIDNVQQIIQERVNYITGKSIKIVAEKKEKDLTKLIALLNSEYGYSIPSTVQEIQIEFK